MAFTDPTANDLKTRFPIFDCVLDEVIEAAIAEAAMHVGQSWIDQLNFTTGKLLIAAHIMVCDGHVKTTESELAQLGEFTSINSGRLRLSKAAPRAMSDTDAWLEKTQYGRRYKQLRARNAPAVAVVTT